MFNGETHHLQGRDGQQIYYMHPCPTTPTLSRHDMPFNILGTHARVGSSTVTRLSYITLELFDYNDDKYYVWLSSSINLYGYKDANTHPESKYDSPIGGVTNNLRSGQWVTIGQRFKLYYRKYCNIISPISENCSKMILIHC